MNIILIRKLANTSELGEKNILMLKVWNKVHLSYFPRLEFHQQNKNCLEI